MEIKHPMILICAIIVFARVIAVTGYLSFLRNTRQSSSHLEEYEAHSYVQILDHFTFLPERFRMFQQRYFVNKKFWGGPEHNHPIFVYLGAQGDIETNLDCLTDSGAKFKALLVYIEHRYYGKSYPYIFGDRPKESTAYGYLTSEQALADYATVITHLRAHLSAQHCPVIVYGEFYGGMLAAYFRLKYPHIAIGALASSAPVLAFDTANMPSHVLDSANSKNFKDASITCANTIKESWTELEKIGFGPEGLKSLSEKFNTCSELRSIYDLESRLIGMFESASLHKFDNVTAICKEIDGAPEGAHIITRIAAGARYVFKDECLQIYSSGDSESSFESLLWQWQTCTEIHSEYEQLENETIFPVRPYDSHRYCAKTFGVRPKLHWLLTQFGFGENFKSVLKRSGSNIIFSNGLRDPFSRQSVLENISESIVALVTEEGSHCQDLEPWYPEDPEWLKEQRSKEMEIIQKWIEEYYEDLQLPLIEQPVLESDETITF